MSESIRLKYSAKEINDFLDEIEKFDEEIFYDRIMSEIKNGENINDFVEVEEFLNELQILIEQIKNGKNINNFADIEECLEKLNLNIEELEKYIKNILENESADEKYFDIDNNGMISLKPQYRGCPPTTDNKSEYAISDKGLGNNGSSFNELPEKIIIPDTINGKEVKSLATGIFLHNYKVTEITLPNTVTEIPNYFARKAYNLKKLNNTNNIEKVGNTCICNTQIEEIDLPNLKYTSISSFKEDDEVNVEGDGYAAFAQTHYLKKINIGNNITIIPANFASNCSSLETIEGGANVKIIDRKAFQHTMNLKKVECLNNKKLLEIRKRSFSRSGIEYDWDTLKEQGCIVDEIGGTPIIENDEKFWIDENGENIAKKYYCENPLATIMNQSDNRWKNKYPFYSTEDQPHWKLGDSDSWDSAIDYWSKNENLNKWASSVNGHDKHYDTCCALFTILHVHSALSGKRYNHPDYFMKELYNISAELSSDYPNYLSEEKAILEKLGYEVETINVNSDHHTGTDKITKEDYIKLCKSLYDGNYIISQISNSAGIEGGHVAVIYGIDKDGKFMVVDSAAYAAQTYLIENDHRDELLLYKIPYQNLVGKYSGSIIVKKKD